MPSLLLPRRHRADAGVNGRESGAQMEEAGWEVAAPVCRRKHHALRRTELTRMAHPVAVGFRVSRTQGYRRRDGKERFVSATPSRRTQISLHNDVISCSCGVAG